MTGAVRCLIALLAVAGAGRAPIAAVPVIRRCQLISKIVDFKVEIHPGTFRPSVADDPETHRLAYWHDRPIVCAYARASGRRETPVFSADEGCSDEKFDLFDAPIGRAVDGPEACVGIEVKGIASRQVKFSVRLNVIKVPPGYPADHGRGVGLAPIEGAAVWGGNGWTLRLLFKPK